MTENGICCFTGHRSYEKDASRRERIAFEKLVNHLIDHGYTTFIAGGALGFDTAAAEYILKKRKKGCNVRLWLALPCANQDERWQEADRLRYEKIKAAADRVDCLSESYYDGCMQERNRYMVNHSSVCVAYCTKSYGGTAGTIRYAQNRGLRIYNIPELTKRAPF